MSNGCLEYIVNQKNFTYYLPSTLTISKALPYKLDQILNAYDVVEIQASRSRRRVKTRRTHSLTEADGLQVDPLNSVSLALPSTFHFLFFFSLHSLPYTFVP